MPDIIYKNRQKTIEIHENGNLIFRGARIRFRNFSGIASKYNAAGKRNFCIVVPSQQVADAITDRGWRVKLVAPRSPDDDPTFQIKVNVNFGNRPPKIELVSSTGVSTQINEDTINDLDYADIDCVDAVLNPYKWDPDDDSPVSAYLKTLRVYLVPDELSYPYDDSPEDE